MSKVKKITVENFKAVKNIELDLNGCTAIVVGKNDSGKTSVITGLPDRIRNERPEIILKEGTEEGFVTMELTTGERFELEFNKSGKDKISFFTEKGFAAKVTKDLVARFFPPLFDIDKFLESQPAQRGKMLEKSLGVDFADIDSEYKSTYQKREDANRDLKTQKIKFAAFTSIPEKVEKIDVSELIKQKDEIRNKLNAKYQENITANAKTTADFEVVKSAKRKEVRDYNTAEKFKNDTISNAISIKDELIKFCYDSAIKEYVDYSKLETYIQ